MRTPVYTILCDECTPVPFVRELRKELPNAIIRRANEVGLGGEDFNGMGIINKVQRDTLVMKGAAEKGYLIFLTANDKQLEVQQRLFASAHQSASKPLTNVIVVEPLEGKRLDDFRRIMPAVHTGISLLLDSPPSEIYKWSSAPCYAVNGSARLYLCIEMSSGVWLGNVTRNRPKPRQRCTLGHSFR